MSLSSISNTVIMPTFPKQYVGRRVSKECGGLKPFRIDYSEGESGEKQKVGIDRYDDAIYRRSLRLGHYTISR